jgi:hypothetical protein
MSMSQEPNRWKRALSLAALLVLAFYFWKFTREVFWFTYSKTRVFSHRRVQVSF